MAYANPQDIVDLHGERFLNDLADRDADGIVDAGVAEAALENATSEINTYLAMRYTTPLAEPIPQIVKIAAIEIASYRMANGLSLSEDVRKRYEDMIALLKQIAAGKAGLGIPADLDPVASDEIYTTPVAYVGRNYR